MNIDLQFKSEDLSSETLTEILTTEIDAIGLYRVIAGNDIEAMIGFEEQKDLLGCDEISCIAEIGGALGVSRIVVTQIGKVGKTFVVNMKLINTDKTQVEGRVYKTVKGEIDSLIGTIQEAVKKLLDPKSETPEPKQSVAPPAPTQPSSGQAPVPAPPPANTPPAPSVTPQLMTSAGPSTPWWGWTLAGLGSVGVGFGTVIAVMALEKNNESDLTQVQGEELESMGLGSTLMLGVGGAALAAGLVGLLLDFSDDPSPTALRVSPLVGPQLVGLGVGGNL